MAMVDACIGYTAGQQRVRPKTRNHPLYVLLKPEGAVDGAA